MENNEQSYQSEEAPMLGVVDLRRSEERGRPWAKAVLLVATCVALAVAVSSVTTYSASSALDLAATDKFSKAALASSSNADGAHFTFETTASSKEAAASSLKKQERPKKGSGEAKNLTIFGRLFYNVSDCEENNVAFATETGYKRNDDFASNSSIFYMSAPPDECIQENTHAGNGEENYFMLRCDEVDGVEQVILEYFESSSCEVVVTYEYFSPYDTTCVESHDASDLHSAAQVLASSCSGKIPEDTLFFEYPHSHDAEKYRLLQYAYENRRFTSQRLEDLGIEPSADAHKLARLYAESDADRWEKKYAAKGEAAQQFGRDMYSPHFWEFALASYPKTAEGKIHDRERIVAHLESHFLQTKAEGAVAARNTNRRRLVADDDDYLDWSCLCSYVDGSGSFLFFTFAYALSTCEDGWWKDGEFEEESVGVILGVELGASVGSGLAYFDSISDVAGVSYTMELGGLIETGVDVDVTMGFTYISDSTSSSIIAVYTGLSAGLSVGASAGAWTQGECYAVDWSGFDVDDEWQKDCFPADALIEMGDGSTKRMAQLSLGDVVATVDLSTGVKKAAPVYLFGHKDSSTLGNYVAVRTATDKRLRLSRGHFLPAIPASSSSMLWKDSVMTRAADLAVGSLIFVANHDAVTPERVVDVKLTAAKGLFNPFTRDGAVIVDGVVASEYSEWILDGILPPAYVPAAYHLIQAPVARLAPRFPALVKALDDTLHQGPSGFTWTHLGTGLAAALLTSSSKEL